MSHDKMPQIASRRNPANEVGKNEGEERGGIEEEGLEGGY